MTLEFSTSDREIANNGLKMLVYAEAGMGKTVLSATLPAPVIISAESGPLSLQGSNLAKIYPAPWTYTTNIPMIKIKTVDQLSEAYQLLAGPHGARFQSIAIDSISEIAEVVLANAKAQVKDPRQAYGELIDKMEMVIRAFRDMPNKHVYMAAKMEPFKDELSGAVKYGPSMPGAKLGPRLPYFFDFVFRMGVNKRPDGTPFRYLQTAADIQYVAKDRSGKLDALEFPHLGNIITKALM